MAGGLSAGGWLPGAMIGGALFLVELFPLMALIPLTSHACGLERVVPLSRILQYDFLSALFLAMYRHGYAEAAPERVPWSLVVYARELYTSEPLIPFACPSFIVLSLQNSYSLRAMTIGDNPAGSFKRKGTTITTINARTTTDMTDTSSTHGLCPAPFMQEDLFPSIGGYGASKSHSERMEIRPAAFHALMQPGDTLTLSFIVPLIAKPDECFNAITPNDMKSDLACAFSGSFIIFGGWAVIVWTVGLALGLAITGVSYRFGSICHINHDNSLADFWGPLMGLAAAALVIQFVTLAYCIHVYIKSLLDNNPTTDNSSVRPSHPGSVRTVSARQAYRRVRRVIQLQWRGIAVVLTIIANVIFFTIIFLSLDNSARRTPELAKKSEPWIFCLVLSKGDKNKCAHLASSLGPNEASIFAVLVLLSLSGIWTIFFLGRYSMILGWIDLVKRKLMRSGEFVSVDARGGASTRDYEMINPPRKEAVKTPEPLLSSSPSVLSMSTVRFSTGKGESEVYAPEVRYTSPALSFSTPRPPSASQNHNNHGRYTGSRDWNPQTSFAQGNPQGSYWYGDSNH
ncbi:hypothetical protein RJZ57_000171 [Blastomyces gilchristii]